MPLTPGTMLHTHEILAAIGAGGMGEVYRARDTKLGRDVAIKVLPEAFSQDKERLARFEREARLLASLNHPNIATVHDLEEFGALSFLVMELVEGQTLGERIAQGRIEVDEALPLFTQIAQGLEAAHEKGVIHRDLKPDNIKVTPEGKVKVLDFGLAKAMAGEPIASDLSQSPTITRAGTKTGVILGTAAYMSPEQARGRPVDERTDVWAFGCCLYETLTGRHAFGGESVTDVLAAIVKEEPAWDRLPQSTPIAVRRLLRRCLTKDPRERLRDIGDARLEVRDALREPEAGREPRMLSSTRRRVTAGAGLVAALLLGVLLGGILWTILASRRELPLSTTIRLEANLPPGYEMSPPRDGSLAVSPDGGLLAFTAQQADGPFELFLRPLDETDARLVDGAEGAWNPFFSPDGRWIGFQAGGAIYKSPTSGGAPQRICEAGAGGVYGAAWLPDDTIIFGGGRYKGLFRVSAQGGTPEELTRPAAEQEGFSHGWPQPLPDGEHVLFTTETLKDSSIAVLSLRTGESRLVVEGGSRPHYVPSGHLVFAQYGAMSTSASLMAAPFDSDRLRLESTPTPVIDGIYSYAAVRFALPQFAVSSNGVLVFTPASDLAVAELTTSLVWVDRTGESRPLLTERLGYWVHRFSPDGRRLAVSHRYDIWLIDLQRRAHTRLTFNEASFQPVWTPDGSRITFTSNGNLHWRSVDRNEEPQPLVPRGNLQHTGSWSPDGRVFAYHEHHPSTGMDMWTVAPESGSEPSPLLVTPFNEGTPTFSPNGRWIAYVSDETGRFEVYVRSYPDGDAKHTISAEGGREPLWAPDGSELFYRNGNRMMVVAINGQQTFRPSEPQLLFEGDYWIQPGYMPRNYDLPPDGRSFLMLKQEQDHVVSRLNVVINWFDELKRLVPAN